MLPEIANLEINTNQTEEVPNQGTSFLFDFKIGDFILKNGRLVKVSDIEALKIWIEKCLRTEKFKFKVYEKENKDLEYGVTIEDLIVGHDYPQSFIESELKREISIGLLKNPMIASLSEWKIEKKNPIVNVSFRVNLKTGETFTQEVNF
ncbi:DUF2634 domain-containing protein (plasmid) [Crassaminicella thermophila]|uniref:DUF2634 domain-containing protein n=1 Tax=Crassaminicella thermophila TaxID=2599308 RepID=A0A5C0SIC1_CRATE|nr:DUF2634 domain-containing protein [Crassaminicella thermophila]QEK13732.1 DUF2634 domain-containing protein [Crassaminicella thermophila]